MNAPGRLLPVILLCFVASCRTVGNEPAMTFEEAKNVVLSMQGVPMVPPPRKMEDILTLLERRRDAGNDQLDRLLQRADAAPPDGLAPRDLYQFYKSRAQARYELSRFNQSRQDIRTAIAHDRSAGIGDGTLKQRLADMEILAGRYETALRLSREAASAKRVTKWHLGPYRAFQSRVHQRMGNFSQAKRAIKSAKALYKQIPAPARLSLIIDGGSLDMGTGNDILTAEAELLESQGHYDQAYALRASSFNYHYSKRKQKPLGSIRAQMAVASNHLGQGRTILAEREAREAVMAAVAVSGKNSGIAADAVQTLAEILLARGDLENTGILSAAQLDILSRLGLSDDEDIMVRARLLAARVNVARQRFPGAMADFDLALAGMAGNPYFLKRYTDRNHGLILSLIKNHRVEEAEGLLERFRKANRTSGRAGAPEDPPLIALEAAVLKRKGQTTAALEAFADALPGLVDMVQNPATDFEKRCLADILLHVYIDMLLELHDRNGGEIHGIDVADELFQLTESQHSKVTGALGENVARAASLTSPDLAELVRQAQDAGKKIKSLKAVLTDATASENASGRSLAALERTIASLEKARAAIGQRIGKKFPRYSNYLHPSPPTIMQIQAALSPGEALISIWSLPGKTCVWAIPRTGEAAFAVAGMGKTAVGNKVAALRKSMQPDALLLSGIPEFDLDAAYDLYRSLLEPVQRGWRQATKLLVVVKGPLDQIPLAILPTAPVAVHHPDDLLFGGYRQVPWLIRKTAIARIPSATSLVSQRALPQGDPDREAFAGFGDPVFSAAQVDAQPRTQQPLASRGATDKALAVRSTRLSELGRLDSDTIASVELDRLCRLPDTAEEIGSIAESLDADPTTDIFLGKMASETRVKTEDLSRKKIIAFATHALRPGDLDGLAQPALAFSSPEVTEQDEDGLLTLGEILNLELNADLVVLSACDTGAGDGRGGEALSGLGRAFFYAGARALLVTMWPVETTSAKMLTTALFRHRQKGNGLSMARALQDSMLGLMDGPGLRNEATGKIVASYAHPFFWAPFVMVGEGGSLVH